MADESRQFDRQVRDAFDRIELSDGAQERILANLLVAQERMRSGEARERRVSLDEGMRTETVQETRGSVERFEVPLAASDGRGGDAPRRESGVRGARIRNRTGISAGEKQDAADDKVIPFLRRRFGWRTLLPLAAVLMVAVVIVRLTGGTVSRKDVVEASSASQSDVAYESMEVDGYASEDSGAAVETEGMSSEDSVQPMAVSDSTTLDAADEAPLASEESETGLTLVDHCPRIAMEDGTLLTALREGLHTEEVPADAVGELVGEATATPFDDPQGDNAVACRVYALRYEDNAYAVRYESETTYWRCEPMD